MMKYVLIILLFAGFGVISCTKAKVVPPPVTLSDCPDTISFATEILPTIDNMCFSCHNSTSPIIKDYATISNNGELILKALRGDGAQLMPEGGPALPEPFIKKFNCWIQQGKQNN